MTVTITPLSEREFFAWYALFAEYAAHEGVTLTDEAVMRVWAALQDPDGFGLVAHDDAGEIVGLIHARTFDRLLQHDGGYQIEDVYVAEGSRRRGVGTALVERARARAEQDRRMLRSAAQPADAAGRALQERFAADGAQMLQTVPVG